MRGTAAASGSCGKTGDSLMIQLEQDGPYMVESVSAQNNDIRFYRDAITRLGPEK